MTDQVAGGLRRMPRHGRKPRRLRTRDKQRDNAGVGRFCSHLFSCLVAKASRANRPISLILSGAQEGRLDSSYVLKETARESAFESIWANDINDVFADVAPYYDRANVFATLGLIDRLRVRFLSTIDVQSKQKVLDVCAGTNSIGTGLLEKQPDLEVHAADRSVAMQQVGRSRAERLGLNIKSHICDVHRLPFPDGHFDVVTLQWATRHLRVIDVMSEIRRVLKPGGHFYHCDMLRPANKLVEDIYCLYLTACVSTIAAAFGSKDAAKKCRRYFVDAIRLFYSVEEFSRLLTELGYADVRGRSVLAGTVGFHKARNP